MKLKYAQLVVLTLIISTNSFAQNWDKSIKLYNQTTFYETIVLQGTTFTNGTITTESTHKSIQYLKPTIAFQWKSKENKWGHEVELTTLESIEVDNEVVTTNRSTNETIEGYRSNYVSIAMRYEIKRFWNIKKIKKLTFELGAGGHPTFYWNSNNPKVSTSFPTKFNNTSLNAILVPGVTYSFFEKCYLNLNVPLNLVTFGLTNQTVRNPSFTANQQKNTTLDISAFDRNIYMRLGLGIKI